MTVFANEECLSFVSDVHRTAPVLWIIPSLGVSIQWSLREVVDRIALRGAEYERFNPKSVVAKPFRRDWLKWSSTRDREKKTTRTPISITTNKERKLKASCRVTLSTPNVANQQMKRLQGLGRSPPASIPVDEIV